MNIQKPKKTRAIMNKWMAESVFQRLDIFGEALPQFNYRGQDIIRTRAGGVFTVILLSLVLLFASVRFVELYSKHNPLIFQW